MTITTNHYCMNTEQWICSHVSDARMQVKIELNAVHNAMSSNSLRYTYVYIYFKVVLSVRT